MFSVWVLFSCPAQQVSNAEHSDRTERLKTNTKSNFLSVFISYISCLLITAAILLEIYILHQSDDLMEV